MPTFIKKEVQIRDKLSKLKTNIISVTIGFKSDIQSAYKPTQNHHV